MSFKAGGISQFYKAYPPFLISSRVYVEKQFFYQTDAREARRWETRWVRLNKEKYLISYKEWARYAIHTMHTKEQ